MASRLAARNFINPISRAIAISASEGQQLLLANFLNAPCAVFIGRPSKGDFGPGGHAAGPVEVSGAFFDAIEALAGEVFDTFLDAGAVALEAVFVPTNETKVGDDLLMHTLDAINAR